MLPFIQCTFFISPHAGFKSEFTCVSWVQFPIGPAHTSGGVLGDCRTIAVVIPSNPDDTQQPLAGRTNPGPFHNVLIAPPFVSKAAKPKLPSTSSAKMTRSPACQAMAYGDALMPGVKFRAA